jgi:hypothetical protein
MVTFQFTGWENPLEIFGSDSLQMVVDTKGEVIVLLRDSEIKDPLQFHQTVYDLLPFFIIDRLHHTPFVLSLFQSTAGIIEDGFTGRGPCQDLGPTIGRIHSTEDSIVASKEAEHDDRPTHECLAEVFIGGAYDVDLQARASRVAHRTDPSPVYHVAEDIESPSL